MISALASVIDSEDPEEINAILDGVLDPVGTFYRFSLATATLGRPKCDVGAPAPQEASP